MPLTKDEIKTGLKKLRDLAKKRKFTQSIDLIINLKDTDIKDQESKLKDVVILPHPLGKKVSVAAFVDKALVTVAREVFDEVILVDDFDQYKDKRKVRKLVRAHDWFVAQANLMGDIAKVFGRFLGPKDRMPDPKAGCIVPPKNELLKPLYDKLQSTVRIRVKDQPMINLRVGVESMKDSELIDNIFSVYNMVVSKLPRHEDQIGVVKLKMTMSRSVSL